MAITTKTQTALIGGSDGEIIISDTAPLPPALEDLQVGVEVKAMSLNPVDTKMIGGYFTPGATSGCEFSGVVTGLGPVAAKESDLKVGDRISAVVLGMNPLKPSVGGFAQHTVSYAYATVRIPDDWTFAQGAGGVGGVAWATVPWALFHSMGLPAGPLLEPLNSQMPPPEIPGLKVPIVTSHTTDGTKKPTAVLVSGGASFTGTCAIQLLKLAGFTVLATCSPRNYDLVRSFGADEVFDYTSPTCAADIKAHTRNCLRLAFDCITTVETTRLCYAALGRAGGRYVALDPYSGAVSNTRSIVHADWVFGMDLLGEDVEWPAPHGRKANPVATEFGVHWNKTLQSLLDRGLVRTHPQLVRDTGFQGILHGMEELRSKAVSGQKLVYTF